MTAPDILKYTRTVANHIFRNTLEEVKVLIHYVEAKDQHTDVRTKPLDWKSLTNHVGTLMNTNTKCQVGYGMGNSDVLSKGSREDGG